MKTRTIFIALLIVIIVALLAFLMFADGPKQQVAEPTSFEECAALYPVMESDPRQCVTPRGVNFIEGEDAAAGTDTDRPIATVGQAGIPDLIAVSYPLPGQRINSPLTVTGEARGTWYFEASFSVEVRDADGDVLTQAPAEAQSDWMTENFVPFSSTISFPEQPAGSKGTLVLRKANPSGLPENDREVTIPILF